uniref:Uncharacterized protein n=1 Tax=Arundo donax TaxID=35708 RepID=A0A0A9GN71_ARUDO
MFSQNCTFLNIHLARSHFYVLTNFHSRQQTLTNRQPICK